MEQLSKILQVLLKQIPYEPFLKGTLDCMSMEQNALVQSVHSYMSSYSDTELNYRMSRLRDFFQEYNAFLRSENINTTRNISVFDAIFYFADKILTKKNNEIMVRYERILRWRMTTVNISEDIFITAFLARHDLQASTYCKDFTWSVVIGHNNTQLKRITERGMAENHFHLWGSAPYFHITWLWVVNHPLEIEHTSLERIESNRRSIPFQNSGEVSEMDLKKSCLQAALIRFYLYSILIDEQVELGDYYIDWEYFIPWIEQFQNQMVDSSKIKVDSDGKLKAFAALRDIEALGEYFSILKKLLNKYVDFSDFEGMVSVSEILTRAFQGCGKYKLRDCSMFFTKEEYKQIWNEKSYQKMMYYLENYNVMSWYIDEIQDMIDFYTINRRDEKARRVDYALNAIDFHGYYENEINEALAGERWFLYEMFRRIERRDMDLEPRIYNLFYTYLVMKERLRSEMVQSNKWVGFENFSIYQSRTGYFPMRQDLEDLKVQLAVDSCWKQNVELLELRITPGNTAEQNRDEIEALDHSINELETDGEKWYGYVMHFIKKQDNEKLSSQFCDYRHENLRREIYERAVAIIDFRRKYPKTASRLVGIDAANQEIGCRPEVFAQAFRTLHNHTSFSFANNKYEKIPQLRITYHVGEDFVDVIDGLRAIDEAVLFLNMDCGDRLGHAIALGIDVKDWYRSKSYNITLTKQDYLDNIVWMYHAITRYHIDGLDNLKNFLEAEYYKYFEDIYARFISQDYVDSIEEKRTFGKTDIKKVLKFDIHAYYDSWKLRGDIPQLYRKEYYLNDFTYITPMAPYSVNHAFPEDFNVRSKSEPVLLYHYYHYNRNVRVEGNRIVDKKVDIDYVKGVKLVQAAMQKEVSQRGIGIETNPSSNYMIGTFSRYEEHPIMKFYNNGLTFNEKELNSSPQIWVSINTDDQGIFNTKLENEYAFLARALEKKTDENGERVYSKSMIYEWLDKIRQMGLNQSFINPKDII